MDALELTARPPAQLRPVTSVDRGSPFSITSSRSSKGYRIAMIVRRIAFVAAASAAALVVLGAPGAGAQQHFPANGLLFEAEVGTNGARSLFDVQTSVGSLTSLSLTIVEGVRVPSVKRAGGWQAGTLTLDSVSAPLTLRLPAHPDERSVPLLRRGALRVTFAPRSKTVLRLSGLPAGTHSVEIALRGGRGQLLSSSGCRDEQNFTATATRAGGASPVHTTNGVTC
jgi:hypothetical protein